MLKRVRDFAQVLGDGTISKSLADTALTALEIDRLGLDGIDRRILRSNTTSIGQAEVISTEKK